MTAEQMTLLATVIIEILVAIQAFKFWIRHPAGFKRYGALLALVFSVVGIILDTGRIFYSTLPQIYAIKIIVLYFIIWIELQASERRFIISEEDALNIYIRFMKSLQEIKRVEEKCDTQ